MHIKKWKDETYEHASSEIEALKKLRYEDISGYSTAYINLFHLLQYVYKPLKAFLITRRPDKIHLLTFYLKSKIREAISIEKHKLYSYLCFIAATAKFLKTIATCMY